MMAALPINLLAVGTYQKMLIMLFCQWLEAMLDHFFINFQKLPVTVRTTRQRFDP